jgi:hypothetical protein
MPQYINLYRSVTGAGLLYEYNVGHSLLPWVDLIQKKSVSEIRSVSMSCKGGNSPTQLGFLKRASLDHWTIREVTSVGCPVIKTKQPK